MGRLKSELVQWGSEQPVEREVCYSYGERKDTAFTSVEGL
jgi:hypothetical protein